MNEHSDTDDGGDGEGVWSPDIEQCFREALLLFPPCGRRKHILQEEGGGKMYGRNELIARHIRMRTGKIRTRKQVSSHIQVLARRKAKAEAAVNGIGPAGSDSPASSVNGPIGSARINSRPNSAASNNNQQNELMGGQQPQQRYYDVWADRPIVTQKIRLVEFSAFIEYRQNQLQSIQTAQPLNNQACSGLANLATAALAANSGPPLLPPDESSMVKAEGHLLSSQLAMNNNGQLVLSTIASTTTTPTYMQQQQQQVIFEGQQAPSAIEMATTVNSNGQQQPLINNHQQLNQRNNQAADTNLILSTNVTNATTINSNHLQENLNHHHPHHVNHQQQQQHQTIPQTPSSGFSRHSYVKIDYKTPYGGQTNKLETIVLSQIQDKFPEIGGSEGLFQRGPSDAFFLVKFWADLNCDYEYNVEDQNSYFGFSCHFETVEPYKVITCSTKACSYGLQVVEKVEKIYCAFNRTNGRYSYEISRSPMCEFMIQFIKKLRQLPRASQMNSVLENFTVLQEITSESTSEVLLCLAYVFEVASPEQNNGSQYHVYKLTKD